MVKNRGWFPKGHRINNGRKRTKEHTNKIINSRKKNNPNWGKGSVNKAGYRLIHIDGKQVLEHRIVWEKHRGPIPPKFQIHHKNGDKLDNRIENLVILSISEHASLHGKERFPKGSRFGNWKCLRDNKGRFIKTEISF